MSSTKPALIFTAPGGVRLARSVEKLCTFATRERGERVVAVDIDHYLLGDHVSSLAPGERETWDALGLSQLLSTPKGHLCKLWRTTLTERVSAVVHETNPDVLVLSLHAVFYNTQSREFFSPVDPDALTSTLRDNGFTPAAVITVIDDIYDVFRHLSRPGELFALRENAPAEQAVRSVINHHLALAWRSTELFHASDLARRVIDTDNAFAKSHLILAAKHELGVVYDAAFGETPLAYISHPIVDVRANREFQEELSHVTSGLRSSRLAAPISPTAIDELIIEQSQGRYRPRLRADRWKFRSGSSVFYVEPEQSNLNPLDPGDQLSPRTEELLASALETLADAITAQVNARDRSLVAQADLLVVWRPYYRGSLANGVTRELLHRNSLRDYDLVTPTEIPAFIYAPSIDLAHFRSTEIIKALVAGAKLAGGREFTAGDVQLLHDAFNSDPEHLAALTNGTLAAEVARRCVEQTLSTFSFPSHEHRSALDPAPEVADHTYNVQRWHEIVTQSQTGKPLDKYQRDGDIIVDDNDLPPDQFIGRVRTSWESHQHVRSNRSWPQ